LRAHTLHCTCCTHAGNHAQATAGIVHSHTPLLHTASHSHSTASVAPTQPHPTWLILHTERRQQQQQTNVLLRGQSASPSAAAAAVAYDASHTHQAHRQLPTQQHRQPPILNHRMIVSRFASVQQDVYSAGWHAHATLMCCQPPPTRFAVTSKMEQRRCHVRLSRPHTRVCCVRKYTSAEQHATAAGLHNIHTARRRSSTQQLWLLPCHLRRSCVLTPTAPLPLSPLQEAKHMITLVSTHQNTGVVQSLMYGSAPRAASPTLSQPLGAHAIPNSSAYMHRCGTQHRTAHTNTRRCKRHTHTATHTVSCLSRAEQYTQPCLHINYSTRTCPLCQAHIPSSITMPPPPPHPPTRTPGSADEHNPHIGFLAHQLPHQRPTL
jgi:hypothetical protein